MFFAFVFNIRRISLCYIAMFLGSLPWLQMIIFMYISCLQLFYLSYEMPYEERATNVIEIINEVSILICSYYAVCLIGLTSNAPEKTLWIGEFMNWTIRVLLLINGIYIAFRMLKAAIQSINKTHMKLRLKWRKAT